VQFTATASSATASWICNRATNHFGFANVVYAEARLKMLIEADTWIEWSQQSYMQVR
jgi:hypothetical protein